MTIDHQHEDPLSAFDGIAPFRTRRNGSVIVRSPDGTQYLRRGPHEIIAAELERHDELVALGYPVAHIVDRGDGWFIERSLGETRLSSLFAAAQPGHPDRDARMHDLTQVLSAYNEAQHRERRTPIDSDRFRADIAFHENDHLFDRSAYRAFSDRIVDAVSSEPGIRCHGDFNCHNIYPSGVIDFEDTFVGPLAYDLATLIVHPTMFASSAEVPGIEHESAFTFTVPERRTLAMILTAHIAGERRDLIVESVLIRLVWAVRRMGDKPIIEAFRVGKLRTLMEAYLDRGLTPDAALGITPLA